MKYHVYLAESTKGGGIYHALPEDGKWKKTASVDNVKTCPASAAKFSEFN